MKYKEQFIESMKWLGEKDDTVFLGQACKVSGHAISSTLEKVPMEKRIELPVFEEAQMGISTGMALEGLVPITMYPRFDFFILAANQIINHLDKIRDMSEGEMTPKVIIRVSVGSKDPIDAGPQHTQDHTLAFRNMLTDIEVIELNNAEDVFPAFRHAYERDDGKSTLLIEYGEYYGKK
jgi:pyruvate/2-oxoglutarate/acetoin dehydrogenase E1 component